MLRSLSCTAPNEPPPVMVQHTYEDLIHEALHCFHHSRCSRIFLQRKQPCWSFLLSNAQPWIPTMHLQQSTGLLLLRLTVVWVTNSSMCNGQDHSSCEHLNTTSMMGSFRIQSDMSSELLPHFIFCFYAAFIRQWRNIFLPHAILDLLLRKDEVITEILGANERWKFLVLIYCWFW